MNYNNNNSNINMSTNCSYVPKHNITRYNGIELNSKIYNTLPIKRIKTGFSITEHLPQTYSLSEYRDIYTRYNLDTKNLLYPVFKQYSCGACWAWSVCSMLSDRYALALNKPNPKISPTSIISGIYCKMARSSDIDLYNACDGGSSFDALILITEISQSQNPVYCDPTVYKSDEDLRYMFKSIDCDGYEWCELNPNCNKSLQQKETSAHLLDQFAREGTLNSIIPQYSTKCAVYKPTNDYSGTQVLPDTSNNTIRIKIKRCYALEDIESIKYSLYTKGTVITNFVIFPDLIHKADYGDKYWMNTDNIYIHKRGCKIYNIGTDDDNDVLLGYHSATIVGWGRHDFNKARLYKLLCLDYKGSDSDTISIEYWICRNTWGDTWNGNGYFRVAMTRKDLGINTEVGMDIPLELHVNDCYMPCDQPCDKGNDVCHKVQFGGCCAADLDVDDISLDTDITETSDKYIVTNSSVITKFSNNNINQVKKDRKCLKYILLIILVILVYVLIRKICKN